MDHNSENTLKLLQDIKELLLGIALLLLGGILAGLGIALAGMTGYDVFLLLLVASLIVLFLGGTYVWHGWTAHEVVERQEEAQNMKP